LQVYGRPLFIMKKLFPLIAILAAAIVSSCGESKFSIDGKLPDAGTQNLRAIYLSGDTIISAWVPVVDGAFRIEGNAEELTVVSIFSSQMREIVNVAVQNGDEITIDGNIKNIYEITVDGTDINSEWHSFLNSHAADFNSKNYEKTDNAIAEFIRKNPDNVVSTLLLMHDYSTPDSPKARQLLNSISEEARPPQLVSLYSEMFKTPPRIEKIPSLTLRNGKDSLELVNMRDYAFTVFHLWKRHDANRDKNISKLKEIDNDRVRIIDICLDTDTMGWSALCARDSVDWHRYKAVGGPVDRTIEKLNAGITPFFIVADSTGTQIYRGNQCDKAAETVHNKINN